VETLAKRSQPRVPLCDAIDSLILRIGQVVMWVNLLLVAIIILQVTLRYGFGSGHPMIEELQWHLYAVGVMFGLSYAQTTDSHVRVDVLAMRLSENAVRRWEIFGILVFLLPFLWVVFYHSLDFVADSWRTNERSDAPLGLPWRWAIKAVIPVSFALLAAAAVSRLIRDVVALSRGAR